MSSSTFALIELLAVFGVILGVAGWQWWEWRQWQRQRPPDAEARNDAAAEQGQGDPPSRDPGA